MTNHMHRFAAELVDVVALGGQRVVIRPLLPQDAELAKGFFSSLSPAARYQRFLSPMRSLPRDSRSSGAGVTSRRRKRGAIRFTAPPA